MRMMGKCGAAVMVGCGFLLGLSLQARSAPPASAKILKLDTLQVRKIQLVDHRGKERGVLEARTDGTAYLSLYDGETEKSASLGVAPDHGPRLLLLEGTTGVATMEVEQDGKPVLMLQPKGGAARTLRP